MCQDITISGRTSFIVYGGGEVGSNCFRSLKNRGFEVLYVLDKNKSGNSVVDGIYTYKLGEEPNSAVKQNSVVIICLANGMLHRETAEQLYRNGYRYIVFLPMQYHLSDDKKRELTRTYNRVLKAGKDMDGQSICPYEKYGSPVFDVNDSVIYRSSGEVAVWCGLELLFSESLELWEGDKTKIHTKSIYKNKHIACNNPCKDLFDYFALYSDDCDLYFSSKKEKKDPEKEREELLQREELFWLFSKEYNQGLGFFTEGAPPVVWNPENYCNLVGGHHRTLFLLHKGHSVFPVRIRDEDFQKWCHKEQLSLVGDYIIKNGIQTFYAPLPHPAFLNFPSRCENGGKTKLEQVMRYFADKNIATLSVLDCMEDEGYFARNLERIGAKKAVFQSFDQTQVELAALLNKLLYRDRVLVRNTMSNQKTEQYDVVFGDAKELATLEKACSQYLLIEFDAQEKEHVCRQTVFADYRCLFREYRKGVVRELGVLTGRG